ncbi:MAG: signal peptidase I [Planctomycetes bacterium]|nr:signal peptidase I [Planctomycetota bacterium]
MERNHSFSKEPWLAVVLSLCMSGVGQIYVGRILRGIILILIELILTYLSFWSLFIPKCDTLISIGLLVAIGAIRIWNLFDAHKCVRKTNPQDFEIERKQSKDPWLALSLSYLIPGLGQLYLKKRLGILFIITAGPMFIVAKKYELLFIGFWGVLNTLICFHAYKSAPVRREKSRRAILIVCIVVLCMNLLEYNKLLFRAYVVAPFKIPDPDDNDWIPPELQKMGPAMKPTLVYNDRFLVRKSRKYVPKRGDVVVFKSPDDHKIPFIMRVAALAGETIQIKDDMLYIDGQKIQWRAIDIMKYSPRGFGIDEPYKVHEDCFFVLGDNIINSNDSRSYGAIPISDLIGKAYKIYWPLSRSGPIE